MSRATSRRRRGFTLVEMMIVLVLTVVMALLVVQLGSHWSDNARLTRVQAQLQHAYDSTKSAALQNPLASTRGESAATLCLLDGAFAVVLGDDCAAHAVWSFAYDAVVGVSLADPDSRCITLDSAGVAIAAADCSTDLRFSITTGSAHVENKSF
ncbi:type II secretion system protein [Rubrivivax gelatinosus]|uniref:type II secretion system protein n=1 Tax=Rubrivivax gelatinosus TaxID=28068 RepID=UPI001905CE57|nr:prepilin-type N-terminal cleavage/methylation domain-containing protein [Rubrivivax gelatinosus]